MALIVLLVAWLASAAGFVALSLNAYDSGAWLLMGILAGALTALFGFSGISLGAMGCSPVLTATGVVLAFPGVTLALYCLAILLWRGAGIDVAIDISGRP